MEVVEIDAPPEEAHLMRDAVRIVARMLIMHYQDARANRKEAA